MSSSAPTFFPQFCSKLFPLWLLMLASGAPSAWGQVSVERLAVRAMVNADASVGLVYHIQLYVPEQAPPLERMFFPLPGHGFQLKQTSAALNGVRLADLRQDRHGPPGFHIHFGSRAIPPGERRTLHVESAVDDQAFRDSRREGYAVLELLPPHFDQQTLGEATALNLSVCPPPGVRADEIHPSEANRSKIGVLGDRIGVTWRWPAVDTAKVGPVRVSFPARGTFRLAARSPLGGPVRWLENRIWLRAVLGLTFVGAGWFLFFRYTAGRGLWIFLVLAAVLAAIMAASAAAQLVLIPALAGLGMFAEWQRWNDRRTADKPTVTTEPKIEFENLLVERPSPWSQEPVRFDEADEPEEAVVAVEEDSSEEPLARRATVVDVELDDDEPNPYPPSDPPGSEPPAS